MIGNLHYFDRWGKISNEQMEQVPGDGRQETLALYTAQKVDTGSGRAIALPRRLSF